MNYKSILLAASAALISTNSFAGGLDNAGQSVSPLFQDGRYIEFSAGFSNGDVTGVDPTGVTTNDIAPVNFIGAAAYKADINEQLSYAIIVDQPFGRKVEYDYTGIYNRTSGDVRTTALTGLLRYKFNDNFSVYGGLRAQRADASVTLGSPNSTGTAMLYYQLETEADYSFGYVAGVAYEIPEYAVRVSLTYNSSISHTLKSSESIEVNGVPALALDSEFDVDTPQSVNLDVQFPVSKSTLIFGGLRWVDWKSTKVSPTLFKANYNTDLLSYDTNTITYRLGVAQKFNESWTGLLLGSYEAKTNDPAGIFGPTDGFASLGIGAIYTIDKLKITGAINYNWLGDGSSARAGVFEDNTAITGGIKFGYTF